MNILLHSCCEKCAAIATKKLINNGHDVTIYFSNSNITPYQAYIDRRNMIKHVADQYCVDFISDEYQHQSWKNYVTQSQHEHCVSCYKFSLEQAYKKYMDLGEFDQFTTTRTMDREHSWEKQKVLNYKYDDFYYLNLRANNGRGKRNQQTDLKDDLHCHCDFLLKATKLHTEVYPDI